MEISLNGQMIKASPPNEELKSAIDEIINKFQFSCDVDRVELLDSYAKDEEDEI